MDPRTEEGRAGKSLFVLLESYTANHLVTRPSLVVSESFAIRFMALRFPSPASFHKCSARDHFCRRLLSTFLMPENPD